ncbi:hypothetical protein ACYPKM_04860 [Pseudomonas aeruginosa]
MQSMINGKILSLVALTLALGSSLLGAAGAGAATLEEQMKNLEGSIKTVEQRRKFAQNDINKNILQAFRDAIIFESVDTEIAEVFDTTARVKVVVHYSVDFEKAKAVRAKINDYYNTVTDRESGVEPYGMIYTNFNECQGVNCTVKTETTRQLKRSAVGMHVSFLGKWETGILTDGSGRFELKPGSFTFTFDVPKSKIKGDPKPAVKGQIYDVHYCSGKSTCSGLEFSPR